MTGWSTSGKGYDWFPGGYLHAQPGHGAALALGKAVQLFRAAAAPSFEGSVFDLAPPRSAIIHSGWRGWEGRGTNPGTGNGGASSLTSGSQTGPEHLRFQVIVMDGKRHPAKRTGSVLIGPQEVG